MRLFFIYRLARDAKICPPPPFPSCSFVIGKSELGQMTLFVGGAGTYYGFSLSENSFTGSVPSQLGRLTGLTGHFNLYSNQLCGAVPPELAALSSQADAWSLEEGNVGLLSGACPTPAPTSLPTAVPAPAPTPAPNFAPTAAPASPMTTAGPTVSPPPSPEPTPGPSATPDPLIYANATSSAGGLSRPLELASGTTVRLALSAADEVLRLSWISANGQEDKAAGRSYGGHDWEGVPPLAFTFDCQALRNGAGCAVAIPNTANGSSIGGYFLTRFTDDGDDRDDRALASRFLAKATFGPSRASITDLVGRLGGSAEAWVQVLLL